MSKQKIAIIGQGTAGCITAAGVSNNINAEIDWYFDPSKSPQSVGEGTTIGFPEFLRRELDWTYSNVEKLDGTYKQGIRKINWNGSGDFLHHFPLGFQGLHFNASKFQKTIAEHFSKKINFIPQTIKNYQEIDASYIIDCSGSPKDYSEYNESQCTPINAAYVVDCYWDNPTFDYSLHVARPYGWVFGIPLKNRCSIGYMYNSNINTLKEIKEDIKNVFSQFNLIPSNNPKFYNFKNYTKKQNFTERVAYNGNSSFFLEPMEATSIDTILHTHWLTLNFLKNPQLPLSTFNQEYTNFLKDVEFCIALHYIAGSKFDTDFWRFAKNKTTPIYHQNQNKRWKEMLEKSKKLQKLNRTSVLKGETLNMGNWSTESFNLNLQELDLYKIINTLSK